MLLLRCIALNSSSEHGLKQWRTISCSFSSKAPPPPTTTQLITYKRMANCNAEQPSGPPEINVVATESLFSVFFEIFRNTLSLSIDSTCNYTNYHHPRNHWSNRIIIVVAPSIFTLLLCWVKLHLPSLPSSNPSAVPTLCHPHPTAAPCPSGRSVRSNFPQTGMAWHSALNCN